MISDIDLKDWIKSEEVVKLHDVPRQSLVSCTSAESNPFWFDHLDGMYSFCKTLQNEVFHLAAWADVFVWKKKG